jgi:uncharacterized alkaline shock family protein YloU
MRSRSNTVAGSLKISNEVVVKIAELAAMEITGVAVRGGHLDTQENPLLIANRFINPIKATLKGEAAEIDISIIVISGGGAEHDGNRRIEGQRENRGGTACRIR